MRMDLNDDNLLVQLQQATDQSLDEADFGIVKMDLSDQVLFYNRYESQLSGLAIKDVVGQNFFVQVAPCTNNFMIAQRYHDEAHLDEVVDYVFTYRMKPTKVTLRLLKNDDTQYLCVKLR